MRTISICMLVFGIMLWMNGSAKAQSGSAGGGSAGAGGGSGAAGGVSRGTSGSGAAGGMSGEGGSGMSGTDATTGDSAGETQQREFGQPAPGDSGGTLDNMGGNGTGGRAPQNGFAPDGTPDDAFNRQFDSRFDEMFNRRFDERFNSQFEERFNNQFDSRFDNDFNNRFNERFDSRFDERFRNDPYFDRFYRNQRQDTDRFDNLNEDRRALFDNRYRRQSPTNPLTDQDQGRLQNQGRGFEDQSRPGQSFQDDTWFDDGGATFEDYRFDGVPQEGMQQNLNRNQVPRDSRFDTRSQTRFQREENLPDSNSGQNLQNQSGQQSGGSQEGSAGQ